MTTIHNIVKLKSLKPLELEGSVAIVGSSDQITGGEEIDSFDHVFRFNLAPTNDKVGHKADFYFFNPNITTFKYPHPEPRQTLYKRLCRTKQIICYPGHAENVVRYSRSTPLLMAMNVFHINDHLGHLLGISMPFGPNHHPRNGIKLIACLVPHVKPVLFGFDLDEREDAGHYYDDELQADSDSAVGHMPSWEYGILREMKGRGLIEVR